MYNRCQIKVILLPQPINVTSGNPGRFGRIINDRLNSYGTKKLCLQIVHKGDDKKFPTLFLPYIRVVIPCSRPHSFCHKVRTGESGDNTLNWIGTVRVKGTDRPFHDSYTWLVSHRVQMVLDLSDHERLLHSQFESRLTVILCQDVSTCFSKGPSPWWIASVRNVPLPSHPNPFSLPLLHPTSWRPFRLGRSPSIRLTP